MAMAGTHGLVRVETFTTAAAKADRTPALCRKQGQRYAIICCRNQCSVKLQYHGARQQPLSLSGICPFLNRRSGPRDCTRWQPTLYPCPGALKYLAVQLI